ncbi:MAG: GNAT family N-acetyltransferase [Chitinophagaceae bacterium]
MKINIRRAKIEDCPRLLELVRELARFERAPDEVTVTLDHFISSGFGEHPVWWGFVAESIPVQEEDSGLVSSPLIHGFALYYIRYSTWKGKRLYLEDILVTEKMRGKGIGELLFERIITEAKEKQLQGINWQVLDWNEPAKKFYRKFNATFDGEWMNCAVDMETP